MYPIVILIKKSSIFFVFHHGTIKTFQLQIKKYHRVGFAIKKIIHFFKKNPKNTLLYLRYYNIFK